MNYYIKILTLLLNIGILFFVFVYPEKTVAKTEDEWMYGITIDDSWYDDIDVSQVVEAIRLLPVKATVRIVMSADISPEKYQNLFSKIHKVAFIMATPVDSSEMVNYKTVESYRNRFIDSYEALQKYVDIWEIGNEINGEDWLGKNNKLIVDKILSAHAFILEKGGKTALTAYYSAPKIQKIDMLDWLDKYIPHSMRKTLDYLFVSYYEDDNSGYIPDWQFIFIQLSKYFPNSKLGIGECGTTNKNYSVKQKINRLQYYYSMPKYTPNYIGGYFWWYWVEDVIPYQNNELWKEFYNLLKVEK